MDGPSSPSGSDAPSMTSYPPLALPHSSGSLSGTGKDIGRGGGEKDKEKKDISHNSEACLFTKDGAGGALEVSWSKLPSRKLEKFLAAVNARGTVTIPLDEVCIVIMAHTYSHIRGLMCPVISACVLFLVDQVKQEIDLVMCQSCHTKLQGTLSSCLQSSQPTVVCSSIKMLAESGGGNAMTVVSPLTTAQIPSLKELICSAMSSKSEADLEADMDALVIDERKKLRLLPGDSLVLPVSSLGLSIPLSFSELVTATDDSAKRASDHAGPLKSKLPLADHKDSSPRGFVEWGPRHNISHLVQGMDSNLTRWIEHLTKLVIRISRLEPFAMFLASADSRDVVRNVVEHVWKAYEKGMEEILDFSIKTRQEQMRETNMPGIFGICLATKSNTQKIKSMLRKKSFLDEMHEGVMRYCREGTETRVILNEVARLARVSDDFFTSEEWQQLDNLEDEILSVSYNFCVSHHARSLICL